MIPLPFVFSVPGLVVSFFDRTSVPPLYPFGCDGWSPGVKCSVLSCFEGETPCHCLLSQRKTTRDCRCGERRKRMRSVTAFCEDGPSGRLWAGGCAPAAAARARRWRCSSCRQLLDRSWFMKHDCNERLPVECCLVFR